MPQCTTCRQDQRTGSTQRHSCLGPKLEKAIVKALRSTFRPSDSARGASKSLEAADGKAESPVAQGMGQHGLGGRIGAEMGVQAGDVLLGAAAGDEGGFDQIDKVAQATSGAGFASYKAFAAANRQPQVRYGL